MKTFVLQTACLYAVQAEPAFLLALERVPRSEHFSFGRTNMEHILSSFLCKEKAEKTFVLQIIYLYAEGKWAMLCFVLKTGFAFIAPENIAVLHSPKVWLKRTGCRLSLLFCLPS